MKKIVLITLAVFLIATAALAIFIVTFDAERLRPVVTDRLEEVFGNPVKLQSLDLGWDGGIALSLSGLGVYLKGEEQAEPVLKLEEASAVLRILPLLRQSIEIGAVRLTRPSLQIVRLETGEVKILGMDPKEKPEKKKDEAATAVALSFFIDSIAAEQGEILFSDETIRPPSHVQIHNADITLKKISLIRPMEIDARLGILSGGQNVRFRSRLYLPGKDRPARLEDVRFETDLANVSMHQLLQAYPPLTQAGIKLIAGNVRLEAERLPLGPENLDRVDAEIHLANGQLALRNIASPFENLVLDASARQNQLKILRASGNWAGGSFEGSGSVVGITQIPQSSVVLRIDQIQLDRVMPEGPRTEPRLSGNLSGSLKLRSQGANRAAIRQTLTGSGEIVIQKGQIVNLNVLREVFQGLSMIPGLMRRLEERLPPDYQEKLNARDTVFEPIEIPVAVGNSQITVDNLRIVSDAFFLTGTAVLGLNGWLYAQCMLTLDPELSAVLIQSVNELRYLADRQGQLQIPLVIQGAMPSVRVVPDLKYVASRLAVVKAQEFIGGLLEKEIGKREETPQTQGAEQPLQARAPYQDLLGSFLRTALGEAEQPAQ